MRISIFIARARTHIDTYAPLWHLWRMCLSEMVKCSIGRHYLSINFQFFLWPNNATSPHRCALFIIIIYGHKVCRAPHIYQMQMDRKQGELLRFTILSFVAVSSLGAFYSIAHTARAHTHKQSSLFFARHCKRFLWDLILWNYQISLTMSSLAERTHWCEIFIQRHIHFPTRHDMRISTWIIHRHTYSWKQKHTKRRKCENAFGERCKMKTKKNKKERHTFDPLARIYFLGAANSLAPPFSLCLSLSHSFAHSLTHSLCDHINHTYISSEWCSTDLELVVYKIYYIYYKMFVHGDNNTIPLLHFSFFSHLRALLNKQYQILCITTTNQQQQPKRNYSNETRNSETTHKCERKKVG